AVGVGAVDVVEAHCDLGYHFETSLPGLEDFSVNGIAQRSYEAVYSRPHFFNDQLLRRWFRPGIDLQLITALMKDTLCLLANVAGSKDAEGAAISHHSSQ